jgi:hypothetical protein
LSDGACLVGLDLHISYHLRFIPEGIAEASRFYSETPTFYKNYLAVRNIADVTSGKSFAV